MMVNIPGIRRDKTMDNKLMYIPNEDKQINPSVDYNYWLKSFDTSSLYNSIKNKFLKFLSQKMMKKCKNLSSMFPLSLLKVFKWRYRGWFAWFIVPKHTARREGTLDCKFHWYPKFIILFVGLKSLGTFMKTDWLVLNLCPIF